MERARESNGVIPSLKNSTTISHEYPHHRAILGIKKVPKRLV